MTGSINSISLSLRLKSPGENRGFLMSGIIVYFIVL